MVAFHNPTQIKSELEFGVRGRSQCNKQENSVVTNHVIKSCVRANGYLCLSHRFDSLIRAMTSLSYGKCVSCVGFVNNS